MNTKYQELDKETKSLARTYKAVTTKNNLSSFNQPCGSRFTPAESGSRFIPTVKSSKLTISRVLISLLMLMSMIATGLLSFHLFFQADYNVSALFTISAYFSMVLFIYTLSVMNRKSSREAI